MLNTGQSLEDAGTVLEEYVSSRTPILGSFTEVHGVLCVEAWEMARDTWPASDVVRYNCPAVTATHGRSSLGCKMGQVS